MVVLYDALRHAGAPDHEAPAAAEAIGAVEGKLEGKLDKIISRLDVIDAKYDARFNQVVWMVGVCMTASSLSLGGTMGVLFHLMLK